MRKGFYLYIWGMENRGEFNKAMKEFDAAMATILARRPDLKKKVQSTTDIINIALQHVSAIRVVELPEARLHIVLYIN